MLKYCALFAAAIMLACASPALAAIEIKVAHGSPASNDKLEGAAQAMKKYVEEKSNGELKMTTYPASSLGSERENLEGLQIGTIEMAILSTGPVPSIFPDIMLIDLPYVIPTKEVAYKVFDGPIGQKLAADMLKKTGIHLLSYGENGFRVFSGKKVMVTPEDYKGVKFRVMENPIYVATVNALDAIPATIPFGELYTALAQGTVDGQDNPVSAVTSMRFYEVQSHLNLDNHVFNPHIVFAADSFFSGLSPEQQQIIRDGAIIFKDEERRLNGIQTEEGLKLMRDKGIVITELTTDQMAVLRGVTKSTYDILRKRLGADVVDNYLAEVETIKAELGIK